MSDISHRAQANQLKAVLAIADKLTRAMSGSTAALYGLPAGDDVLRRAHQDCGELLRAIKSDEPPNRQRVLLEQLRGNTQAAVVLGALAPAEAETVQNLMDNLWNQIDREA